MQKKTIYKNQLVHDLIFTYFCKCSTFKISKINLIFFQLFSDNKCGNLDIYFPFLPVFKLLIFQSFVFFCFFSQILLTAQQVETLKSGLKFYLRLFRNKKIFFFT